MERPLPASMTAYAQPAYRIELSVNVADATALWQAAFDKGLSSLAASHEDLVEMIGPHQDVDCVAGLAGTIGYEILTGLGRRFCRRYEGTFDGQAPAVEAGTA